MVRNCAPENLEIPRCAIAHLRSGPSDHPGMTAEEKKGARGPGGQVEPRALCKEEVGSLLFSADVNAVTSDVE
jgi:hypothetical protein